MQDDLDLAQVGVLPRRYAPCASSVPGWSPDGQRGLIIVRPVAVYDPALAAHSTYPGAVEWAADHLDRGLVRLRSECDHATELTRPNAARLADLVVQSIEATMSGGRLREHEALEILTPCEALYARLGGLLPRLRADA